MIKVFFQMVLKTNKFYYPFLNAIFFLNKIKELIVILELLCAVHNKNHL